MLFNRIIIGVSDIATGLDAVALARNVSADGCEMTLTHVNVTHPVHLKGLLREVSFGGHDTTERLLATLNKATGISATAVVDAHSVGQGLHEFAEEKGADLIVLGSTLHRRVGRALLGDDIRAALSTAPCAVAVAPAGYAESAVPIRTLGVAYNQTEESRRALTIARSIAVDLGARLSARQAVTLPAFVGGQTMIPYNTILAETRAAAQRELDKLDGVDAHATFGEIHEVLTAYSSSVDLLLIGSRRLGPVGRMSHWSVSRSMCHSSHCPLLVIPSSRRTAHRPVREVMSARSG